MPDPSPPCMLSKPLYKKIKHLLQIEKNQNTLVSTEHRECTTAVSESWLSMIEPCMMDCLFVNSHLFNFERATKAEWKQEHLSSPVVFTFSLQINDLARTND